SGAEAGGRRAARGGRFGARGRPSGLLARRRNAAAHGTRASALLWRFAARRHAAGGRVVGARRESHADRGAARGGSHDSREHHRPHARRDGGGPPRRVAVRPYHFELSWDRRLRDGGRCGGALSGAAPRAQVGPVRHALPLLPAAGDAGPGQPSRRDRRLARPDARCRAGRVVLARVSAAQRAAARVGHWRLDRGELHRAGPRHPRLAGAARGNVLRVGLRAGARAVRRHARGGADAGAVPVSMYPLMLDGPAIRALVVGGGPVAARKVRGLLGSGASVRVLATALSPAVRELHPNPRLVILSPRAYTAAAIEDATLVIAATDDHRVNAAVAADARARGCLVNVVDDPAAGTCVTP